MVLLCHDVYLREEPGDNGPDSTNAKNMSRHLRVVRVGIHRQNPQKLPNLESVSSIVVYPELSV